ncbi:MAG TPA: LysM peptidoglycan-binding domain-containing protein, partial [Anaerolineales bacterium]|nr:LysM peptidoglycan-binding domain-containing protein [Anaerolineales bacterium]
DDEKKEVSTFAIVDGAKLLQNDPDEQEVLSNALEQKIPIVMENSNKEITSALTGTGVDHEVVVLKPEGNRVTLSLLEDSSSTVMAEQGDAAGDQPRSKSLKATGGGSEEAAQAEEVEAVNVQQTSVEDRIEQALLASDAADAPPADVDEEPKPWHYIGKVDLPKRDYNLNYTALGKSQLFSIMVDMKYDLYATTNPPHKYMRVQLLGTGFSAGDMVDDTDSGRRSIQDLMMVRFGPSWAYDGMSIEELNPKNKNQDGSWTVSTGFSVGITESFSLGAGVDVSAGYDNAYTSSISLQDFDVINKSNDVTAEFIYKLASMEGHPINDENLDGEWDDSAANPNVNRFRRAPVLAKTVLTPRCEVIWRFPHDFNNKVTMHVQLSQRIIDLFYGTDDEPHGIFYGPNKVDTTFDVDLSKVQVPEKLEASIPKFAARILVEYKPEKGEVFKLRSLGDGTFEILESSTVQIPPQAGPPILAYHTVRRGDMLSAISLRYYGSAARSRWYPIYEANKDVMEGGYNDLRPGMVLKIPKEAAD